jgi:penicillin-binding protein 2
MALPPPVDGKKRTIDPVKVRLSILGMLVFALFVGLFSRLWYLQVLDSAEFAAIAKENQVRRIESEPPRGRILTRGGQVIVDNKLSLAVSLEHDLIDKPGKRRLVLTRLSKTLKIPTRELRKEVLDATVSPYKPVAVATQVSKKKVFYIKEHPEMFPGVVIESIPVRRVLHGYLAPHVIGYTSEISADELKLPEWRDYRAGDIIGKAGVERTLDSYLRGKPQIERFIVDSADEVVKGPTVIQEEEPGADVVTTIAPRIQRAAQSALTSGILTARAEYPAVTGGAVVMDPRDGDVLAMASYPTYDASILADGFSFKDEKVLGVKTVNDLTDDALKDRAYQAPLPPGSTFKVVTAAAAMNLGVYEPTSYLSCPGTFSPGDSFTEFYNWTTSDLGSMNLVEAIEQSCNTFFFQLGWTMESRWGEIGDGTFAFQRIVRRMGYGHPTGLALPYEAVGRVPDPQMCDLPTFCPEGGYLPGYTVNMAVGQGDLLVTPMQMAVATAAIANGGDVLKPRIVKELRTTDEVSGDEVILKEFEREVRDRIELTETEWAAIRTGMEQVVAGSAGTASSAFAGFPNPAFPVAGKTGSAQTGEGSDAPPHSWFISYAPADAPKYVIAVQVELGGHGGETAAPIAREIYEAIFQGDTSTGDVNSGSDSSD